MNSFKISFEQLRQNPSIAEMLDALERGFKKYGIDFYLVGALARDTWMATKNKIAKRTTSDVDFGVFIANKNVYAELKEYLIGEEGFNPYSGNSFVLLWKDNTEVDLMPFGEIEINGKVQIDGTGLTTLFVDGFQEVYDEGLPMAELESGNQFKFCTLPGIVLLKLIAYDDRPEMRRDDILDISDILKHYFDINDDEIYNKHSDLFAVESASLTDIATTVLGRDIGSILKRNARIAERIIGILNHNTTSAHQSRIGAIMTEYFDNTVEENIILLNKLLTGINETLKK